VSDITSHVLMVTMETHETLELLVMMSAVSSHSGGASYTTDVFCLLFLRCRENETKLWETISENVFSGRFGVHFLHFQCFS
jgi:hypothetical protein